MGGSAWQNKQSSVQECDATDADKRCVVDQNIYSTIIFTTISFIKEAPLVPVSPTPTPLRLY